MLNFETFIVSVFFDCIFELLINYNKS